MKATSMKFGAPAAVSDRTATRLPVLRDRLEATRRRARHALILRGAVFSLVTTLALLCAVEAIGFYQIATTSTSAVAAAALSSYVAWGVVAFVCAFSLAAIFAYIFTPDVATLARKADRAFGLQERLSTALEVAADERSEMGPVRAALLTDAERQAAAIDPRQIVRLDLPRAIWIAPALIAMAAALQLAPPKAFSVTGLQRSTATAGQKDAELSSRDAAEAASNLRRIAELVEKDAQKRSDPYLRTIAKTLQSLSSDAERPGVDRRVLAGALDRLMAHARQAYSQAQTTDSGQTAREVMQQLQAALDDIAGNRQVEAAKPRESDVAAGSVGAAERSQTRRLSQSSEHVAEAAAASRPATQNLKPSLDDLLKDLDDYDPVDPRIEKERAFAAEQRRARAASQSAGAAQDAGQGEGDRAGDGTRPLGNGDFVAGSGRCERRAHPHRNSAEGRAVRRCATNGRNRRRVAESP
jgi:hypothetical protein